MADIDYGDEPQTMKDLREMRQRLSEELKGMTGEEMVAHFRKVGENFEKETGIKLPKLQKIIK